MQYTTLNNGVKMPMVGFGVFQIPDQDQCQKVVEEAIKTGYRLIDTAEAYGNEEAVGKAIKASGVPREELFITTKVFIQHMSYEGTKEAFAESLKKLDLAYLDLYLLHQPVGDTFGAWRALEELYKEGKIRAIGVSNFKPDQIANLSLFNDITPAVNQVEVHVFNQKEEEKIYLTSKGIQMESWGAFAEGQFDIFNNPILTELQLSMANQLLKLCFAGNCSAVLSACLNLPILSVSVKISTFLILNCQMKTWQKSPQSIPTQPFLQTITMLQQLNCWLVLWARAFKKTK